ncbi:Nitronate monooxygenase [Paenibacillus algorifonticola]|uniref:Nitronate monooxygenase n=1 Tax=Paenibacillus algorifonticola TaxID=684063 RepID=A0A1I2FH06_9BACL|nr:nitronate monooxygenase [Paenibacillus algorifonticola]SFF03890.1 Nitronate monooxygenase [Paenibacillus algorifonticola]
MKNQITELLGIEYPIISAAMTWVTSAEFVAAVSNAGGMGVLGPNAGQTEKSTSAEDMANRLMYLPRTIGMR